MKFSDFGFDPALMEGIEAKVFFTFFGLDAITKKQMKRLKTATVGNPAMHIPTVIGAIPGMSAMATMMMKKKMVQDEIRKKNIHIGDTVEIQRAGDVIPQVLKVVKFNNKRNNIVLPPKKCPVCGSATQKEKDEAFDYGGFTFAKEALNLIDNLTRSKLKHEIT